MKAKKKSAARPKAVAKKLVPPAIGEYWKGQGGDFVGTVLGIDGGRNYHLIVGPESKDKGPWQKLMDWAKKLVVEGHKDFDLANRREQRFLYCQAKHLHPSGYYWSNEQYAGSSSHAWSQGFDDGTQGYWYEGRGLAARAVRRIYI